MACCPIDYKPTTKSVMFLCQINLGDSNFMKIETLVFAFRNVFEDVMPLISAILLRHPILYNVLIVPIAYLIKQCRITNLVGWWPLQSSIGILTIDLGKSWWSWENNWCSSYMTHPFWQLSDISSNWLVCGNSDKNYGDKDGHELILVWIFDFQSMLSLSSEHVITGITNGPIVSVHELNIFKTCMLWMMFTVFATKN